MLLFHLLLARVAALAAKRDESGQATAEYALVLLGAAAIAVFVIGWVARTGLIDQLLDTVFTSLIKKAK